MVDFNIEAGADGIYVGIVNEWRTHWITKTELTEKALMSARDYMLSKIRGDNKSYSKSWKDRKHNRKITLKVIVKELE